MPSILADPNVDALKWKTCGNCAPTEALERSTEVSVRFVIKASRSMVRIDTTSVHQDDVAGLTGKCEGGLRRVLR